MLEEQKSLSRHEPGRIEDEADASLAGRRAVYAYRSYLRQLADEWVGGELRQRVDPSDVVQEALLKGTARLGEFRGESDAEFAAWLKEILRNVVTDFARHHLAEKRDLRRDGPLQEPVVAHDPSPSASVRQREEIERVQAALQALPEDQRRAIELRIEGLGFGEIGAALGRSADAARMLWGRAITRLTELVEPEHGRS